MTYRKATIRSFAPSDGPLLFGLASLDRGADRRTLAVLERETVFVAELEGAPADWLPTIAGVELVERHDGDLRLLADRDADAERVLAEAQRVARVVAFSYGPPSLAELFVELIQS